MTDSAIRNPRIIYVFSGKRKSGKDYVTTLLEQRLGDRSIILRLSGPLKQAYAEENSLDYQRLLDASDYKEKHRASMIAWGEAKRKEDHGYFCRLAIRTAGDHHDAWIISDARRPSDVKFFKKNYPTQTVTVRVMAEIDIRERRGLVVTKGIDDAPSECALDDYSPWDAVIENNGNQGEVDRQLEILAFMADDREGDR